MRDWNQLKIEVLKSLERSPMTTAKQLSDSLSISRASAGMCLVRYTRQGLVSRVKRVGSFGKASYVYLITERGASRLSYLRKD